MAGKTVRETLIKSSGDIHFNELSLKKPFGSYPVEGLTFFGHYWLDPSEIGPQTDRLACLDYSVARGGCLAAYRHESGQTAISADQFVAVPALPVNPGCSPSDGQSETAMTTISTVRSHGRHQSPASSFRISSFESRLDMSAPSSRASASDFFVSCSRRIFSSIVFSAMRR